MKTKLTTSRLFRVGMFAALLVPLGMSVSCMTTYDAYGRPIQTVDPAVAVAGVAAAGLIGYAAGDHHHHDHHYYHDGYYGRGYYGGGYYGGGYYRGHRYHY